MSCIDVYILELCLMFVLHVVNHLDTRLANELTNAMPDETNQRLTSFDTGQIGSNGS